MNNIISIIPNHPEQSMVLLTLVKHQLISRVSLCNKKSNSNVIINSTTDLFQYSVNQAKKKQNALWYFQNLLETCAVDLNCLLDHETPQETLQFYIAHLERFNRNTKKMDPVDHTLAIAFASAALNASNIDGKEALMTEIRAQFPDIRNIDLLKEYGALGRMSKDAAAKNEGISEKDGFKYFNLQYGDTPLKQIISFFKEFGKLPSDVEKDKDIEKSFVNRHFIRAYNEIVESDPKTKTEIDFSNQDLFRIPININRLTELTTLKISNTSITHLPVEIFTLAKLEKLELSYNKLVHLPDAIGYLKALKTLNLLENKLTELPNMIGNLKVLTELNISDNNLTRLPITIIELKQLEQLYLHFNKDLDLSIKLDNLKKLRSLGLIGITGSPYFPLTILGMESLEWVGHDSGSLKPKDTQRFLELKRAMKILNIDFDSKAPTLKEAQQKGHSQSLCPVASQHHRSKKS